MGIKAVRLRKTTDWNICSDNNGNCSHICLYRHNKTRVCACQWGYELTSDGLNCVVPKAYLLYAKNAGIGRISIENINTQNEIMVPIIGLKYARCVLFFNLFFVYLYIHLLSGITGILLYFYCVGFMSWCCNCILQVSCHNL